VDARLLIDAIVALRQQQRLKLPDAIVAATAQVSRAYLVTADQQFQSAAAVPVVRF
jgi:predicted nucleic acid-binding protein